MANQDSGGATALLGLDGFVVLAQTENNGELWLLVETTAEVVGCPSCGMRARAHGRRAVKVRDLAVAGRPVVLVWRKRIWICEEPLCKKATWSETTPQIRSRAELTERARWQMCQRVGQDGQSVAQVARDFGVGWHAAMGAVRDHGAPLVEDPARIQGVQTLGLDESSFLVATPTSPTRYITGFVDLGRPCLLDVVLDRSAAAVECWLNKADRAWLARITTVALDPHRGYAKGLMTQLSHARMVLDHFHVVALANDAIDDVRRRVQSETLGHRGRRDDPLYRIRRLLLVGHERLSERGLQRLWAGLGCGDRYGEVGALYLGKEFLREVYSATSPTQARQRLDAFYAWCAKAEVAELTRLATTISTWEAEVLAYHDTGVSNGPTEAMNLLVKKIKRVGHGFRNFDNYRLRLLLHCGGVKWQTQPTARIRGRHPRLVA